MSLYIVILAIFLTYTLTRMKKEDNWFFSLREKDRLLAFWTFTIFFFINLVYLYIVYILIYLKKFFLFNWFINLLYNWFSNCIWIISILDYISIFSYGGVFFCLFIPMLIYSTFNLNICPEVYKNLQGRSRIFFILAIIIILGGSFMVTVMSILAIILSIGAVIGVFWFFWFLRKYLQKKYWKFKCPECSIYISEPISESNKFCFRCGKELTRKAKFCSTCGHIIEREDKKK